MEKPPSLLFFTSSLQSTSTNVLFHSLAKPGHLWLLLLFFVFFTPKLFAQEKTLSINASNFVQEVVKNNFDYKLSSLDEKIKLAIYHETKGQLYISPLNLTYRQNTNEIPGASNSLSFGADWSHVFLRTGSKLSVRLDNTLSKRNPSLLSSQPSSETWRNTIDLIKFEQPFLRNSFFGNYNNRFLDIYRFEVQRSRSDFNLNAEAIVYRALSSFFLYQINVESLKTLELDLIDAKETLVFNRRKERLGTIDEKDLISSEVLTIQIQLQVNSLKKELDLLRNNLLAFIGKSSGDYQKIEISDETKYPKQEYKLSSSYALALENREDYKKIYLDQLAAENSLQVGKLARLPELNATFGLSLIGSGDTLGDSYNDLGFSLDKMDISWGLKFGFYTDLKWYSYAVERAQVLIQQAELNLKKTKLAIYNEVEERILNINNALQQLNDRQRIQNFIRRKYQLSRKDYFNGRIDFSDNINSKKELQTAELDYLTQKLSYQQALLDYQWTTGILLSQFNIKVLDAQAKVPN